MFINIIFKNKSLIRRVQSVCLCSNCRDIFCLAKLLKEVSAFSTVLIFENCLYFWRNNLGHVTRKRFLYRNRILSAYSKSLHTIQTLFDVQLSYLYYILSMKWVNNISGFYVHCVFVLLSILSKIKLLENGKIGFFYPF